jgi:hypothetical protein
MGSVSHPPKICAKCNSPFPKTMMIDGKKVFLHTRKFCLSCSPIGTRHLCGPSGPRNGNPTKHICGICSKGYHGGHLIRAGICHCCAMTKHRNKKKQQIVEYLGGKCAVCSYNKCVRALQCHHLDKSEKEFTVSRRTLSWEKLVKELDKCILLCANCHSEYHAGLIDLSPFAH